MHFENGTCRKISHQETQTIGQTHQMKTRLASLLLLLTGQLASCSSYEIKSAQTEEHPCYSTWHFYPKNS